MPPTVAIPIILYITEMAHQSIDIPRFVVKNPILPRGSLAAVTLQILGKIETEILLSANHKYLFNNFIITLQPLDISLNSYNTVCPQTTLKNLFVRK